MDEKISEEKEASSDSVEVSGQKAHTPGPWETTGDACHPRNIRITSPGRRHIAKVYAESLNRDEACEANAALIAAAPELLEGCEIAYRLCKERGDYEYAAMFKAITDQATSVGRGTEEHLAAPGNPKSPESIQSKVAIADRVYEASEKVTWRVLEE